MQDLQPASRISQTRQSPDRGIERPTRNKGLGVWEIWALGVFYTGTKIFLDYPRFIIELGATGTWLIVVISTLAGCLGWLVVTGLLMQYPGKSLAEIYQHCFGKFWGNLINLIFIAYVFASGALILLQFTGLIVLTALPKVAPLLVALFFTVASVWGARMGIVALGRGALLSLYLVGIGALVLLLLIVPVWDINLLRPFAGTGYGQLIKAGLVGISGYGEILALAFFVPAYSCDEKELRRAGLIAMAVVGLYLLGLTSFYMMRFTLANSIENFTPFFELSRIASTKNNDQRLEAIFVLVWTLSAFVRVAINIALSAFILERIWRRLHYGWSALLIGFAMMATAWGMSALGINYLNNTWMQHCWGSLITFALPSLLWLWGLRTGWQPDWRRKGKAS